MYDGRKFSYPPPYTGHANAHPSSYSPKVAFSPVLVTASSEEYAHIIANVTSDAVKTIKRKYLVHDLKALFLANTVSDDVSFRCLVEDSDLPSSAPLRANPDFAIDSDPLFTHENEFYDTTRST